MLLSLSSHCRHRINRVIDLLASNRLYSRISKECDHKTDVLVVGGGIVGYSTAYWLKTEQPKIRVTLVERDMTYTHASTVLSVGGVRQQFSEPENIRMSLFCSHVISNMNKYFSVGGDGSKNLDVQFRKRGYLLLSSGDGNDVLKKNFEMQRRLGACVSLMSKKEIKIAWPWLNVDDIECAVHGYDNEGWFDPWLLLSHVMFKVKDLGVNVINGTLDSLHGSAGILEEAQIRTRDGEIKRVQFSHLVNSTGAWASEVMEMAERAAGFSGSQYPLFVKKCKRYVFNCYCPTFPKEIMTPMIFDYTGVYFRKESGGNFICGVSPTERNEPSCDNLDVDYQWFDDSIWPHLWHRVPFMEAMKVKSAWAGFYDFNVKDQNLIIGRHPAIRNMILCNGSSGHGIQHGLAIGRANMELIIHDEFRSIDLRRLCYERFMRNELVFERNIF